MKMKLEDTEQEGWETVVILKKHKNGLMMKTDVGQVTMKEMIVIANALITTGSKMLTSLKLENNKFEYQDAGLVDDPERKEDEENE